MAGDELTTYAVRDDGALLVVSGPAAVVVGPDGDMWVTGRDAALSRGSWSPSAAPVPEIGPGTLAELERYRTDLLGSQPPSAVPRMTMDYPVDVTFPDQAESRAAGHDTTPGHDELHHYWTVGEGAGKWHDFTTLYDHLVPHVGPARAKRMAAAWFHERYGIWPGSDLNRVAHGKPPRGQRVGPG